MHSYLQDDGDDIDENPYRTAKRRTRVTNAESIQEMMRSESKNAQLTVTLIEMMKKQQETSEKQGMERNQLLRDLLLNK